MSSEARCYRCDKLLGVSANKAHPIVFPMSVKTTEHQALFLIKCPRCGSGNYIKFKNETS